MSMSTKYRDTNSNCLAGYQCPRCEHTSSFNIWGTVLCEVYDSGVDEYREPMWEPSSRCTCIGCGHAGTVRDFIVPSCPECGCTVLSVAVHTMYKMVSGKFTGDVVTDGPEENLTSGSLVQCTDCDWHGAYSLCEPASQTVSHGKAKKESKG